MQDQSYWNTRRSFLFAVAIGFVIANVLSFFMQQQSVKALRLSINEQQEFALDIRKQIGDVQSAIAKTEDVVQQQNLMLERMELESTLLNAEIRRLDLEDSYTTMTMGQSGHIILAVTGILFLLYVVLFHAH